MNVQTYLFFDGRCEEAIDLYRDVFGASLEFLIRFKDGPLELAFPGGEEKIFHATLLFGQTRLNMADLPGGERTYFAGFALLTHFDTVDEAGRVFGSLATDGRIKLALEETFWAARYGIVEDRFGITWKIQVDK